MDEKTSKRTTLLLVEDDPADVRLIQEAIKESDIHSLLYVVEDGLEAIDFLFRKGKFAQAPRPDLILLDLNLPKKNGHEVLAEIKTHDPIKRIPVIIFTTSEAERDILKSYDLHANCYMTKSLDLSLFIRSIKMFVEYWMTEVKLPTFNR